MKAYQRLSLTAAFALGLAGVAGAPAFAQTVADEARCNDAKNSGSQNDIRQFCPVADWPQTVEPEVQTWILQQSSPDIAFDGEVVVGTALPETVQLIEVPNFTQYRWAMLDGKRVLVMPENRTVIAVY